MLVRRRNRFVRRFGRKQPRTRVGDVLVDGLFVLREALGRFDKIGDQIVAPLELAIDRAGARFRKSRSSSDLNLFVKKIIEYSNQESFLVRAIEAEDVWSALGEGVVCEVDVRRGIFYEARDTAGAGYCLIPKKTGLVEAGGGEIVNILRLDRLESPARWCSVFRARSRLN